ncbi:2241_t:CDS:1, partial [Acaulospora colombiana]
LEQDPKNRPAISEIFNTLHKDHERTQLQQSGSQSSPIEILSDNDELDITETNPQYIMSVQDAIIEHKRGNKKEAWKCFSYHAENGDMHAKFWVGYYLYHSEIDELKYNMEDNLIKAAQLFKEAADDGKAEAQLRYGTCLWLGKGVKINYNEAIKYLTLAADNGNVNAMYNVGSAYYSGKG